jgi:hypothetical protein
MSGNESLALLFCGMDGWMAHSGMRSERARATLQRTTVYYRHTLYHRDLQYTTETYSILETYSIPQIPTVYYRYLQYTTETYSIPQRPTVY